MAFSLLRRHREAGHKFQHSGRDDAHRAKLSRALTDPSVDLVALERDKIKGAIRTDFILSAEIIVITLGTVAAASLSTRIGVLVGISLLMTVGVYGLVAGIVKQDDGGLALTRSASTALQSLGRAILVAAPWLMKALSIAGTAAMFLVGGDILTARNPGAASLRGDGVARHHRPDGHAGQLAVRWPRRNTGRSASWPRW